MKKIVFGILWLVQSAVCAHEQELNVAILGLGGRAQDLLSECVKLKGVEKKSIRVVAVCDEHAQDSLDFFMGNCLAQDLLGDYQRMFEQAQIYPDNADGIQALFFEHPNLDCIFITSPNYRHAEHLQAALENSSCKHLYLEKPLFRTLQEFNDFEGDLGERKVHVGLTLRYAMITKLVVEQLRAYQSQLGKLRSVHSWEHVNFGHGLSIIMMNWRRMFSLSGGLLLDKSIHDLDLALYYMEAVDAHPESFSVSTVASHNFYKKSNREAITNRLLNDAEIRDNAELWDKIAWQRIIPYSYSEERIIDWQKTMDQFFQDFPDDAHLAGSDLIADDHQLQAKIRTTSGDEIDFTLDVKLDGFEVSSKRGCHMVFENGEVEIDLRKNKVKIQQKKKEPVVFDLNIGKVPHSGGDSFVARAILDTLPKGYPAAEFSDSSVQIATIMALVSEGQAKACNVKTCRVVKLNSEWVVAQ